VTEWLLLIHQLPPKPDYLRVKTARRLQRIGALPLKNTVYVLPATAATIEDMQWTVRDIRSSGGEANLCRAQFIDGVADADLQQRFNDARDADYAPLLRQAKRRGADLDALRRRCEAIRAVDHFGAPKGQALQSLLDRNKGGANVSKLRLHNRVWVTRAGIHVDRMASAWLVRRFIDRKAAFRFVRADAKAAKDEVRFDMFDAEFTHEGGRCTFEVLLRRAGIADRALQAIGEIVHDIDLHDDKFKRPETAGVAAIVNGIARAHRDDRARLRRAIEAFDDLYAALMGSGLSL
jgi:hypothetical protein